MAATELSTTPLASDANLKAYFKLEDVNDSTANAYNLTNHGTSTFTSAKFNNGGNFGSSGSGKYLSILNDLGITGGAITMVGWVKLLTELTGSGEYTFFSQGDAGNKVTYRMDYEYNSGNPRLRAQRIRQGTSVDEVTYNTGGLGTSVFHQLALVYDGSNLSAYMDGSLVAGPTAYSGNGSSGGADQFSIGAEETGAFGQNWSYAVIDDVAVFNRALTATEISNLYNGFPVEGGYYFMSV